MSSEDYVKPQAWNENDEKKGRNEDRKGRNGLTLFF